LTLASCRNGRYMMELPSGISFASPRYTWAPRNHLSIHIAPAAIPPPISTNSATHGHHRWINQKPFSKPFTPLKSAISEPTQGSSDKSCKQSLHPTKHQAASLLVAICSRRKAQPQLSPTSDTKNAHIKDKHLGSLHWDEDLGACYPSQCDRPTQTAPL
jgi:hypothetical protein